METESWRGLRHRHLAKAAGNRNPHAYRHRAFPRLYHSAAIPRWPRHPPMSELGQQHACVPHLPNVGFTPGSRPCCYAGQIRTCDLVCFTHSLSTLD